MLTFYNGDFSPNCLKTQILLLELGVEFSQQDLSREELRQEAFASRFPSAMVPALDDEGLHLIESGAIALYLAEKHQQLMPSELRQRALMHQAMQVEAAFVAPVIGGMGLFGEFARPEAEQNPERIGHLMGLAQKAAGLLGHLLGEKPYFAGEFSLADIQLFPGLTKALQHGLFQSPPSGLVAWDRQMWERSSVQQATKGYPMYHR